MSRQFSDLKRKPRIIIGTPGRINDHLERGSLHLGSTRFLVVDEADRMLDMGFGVQLDRIAEYLPKERQTLMFSATFPPNMDKLSKKYLNTEYLHEIYWFLSDSKTGFSIFADRFRRSRASETCARLTAGLCSLTAS